MTNTTELSRAGVAGRLADAGFDVGPEDLITATAATASYLRDNHPGARCFLVAEVAGKPAPAFFRQARSLLGLPSEAVAMVGDDVETDVLAAQAVGMTGVLVRTAKFREDSLERASGRPDRMVDSVAGVPAMVEASKG